MGEYADMMLDGTCCAECGEIMDDILDDAQPPGYPRYCSRECTPIELRAAKPMKRAPPAAPPIQGKHVHNPPYASKADKRRAQRQRRAARTKAEQTTAGRTA